MGWLARLVRIDASVRGADDPQSQDLNNIMTTLPGQHRPETQASELAYWEDHGGVKEFDLHLPSYSRVFPISDLDFTTLRILDVGSGPISIFEAVCPADAYVVPYDTLAAQYNRIAPQKKFPVRDTIPAEAFGLITLFNMLDHMDSPGELLEVLTSHLEANGRVWIFVHLDRPFSPAEHPQKFRFWRMAPLIEQYFSIERCGLTREGKFVYAWWGICRPKDGTPSRMRQIVLTARVGLTYARFHTRRAAIKAVKVAGFRRWLPKALQY